MSSKKSKSMQWSLLAVIVLAISTIAAIVYDSAARRNLEPPRAPPQEVRGATEQPTVSANTRVEVKNAPALTVARQTSTYVPDANGSAVSSEGSAPDPVAHQAFEQALNCHSAFVVSQSLETQIVNCEAESNNPQNAAFYASCKVRMDDAKKQLDQQSNTLKACGRASAKDVANAYYQSLTTAARRGDVDAQICYFQGSFGRELTDDEMAQYQADAKDYAKAALARGDWRIVQLLTMAPGDRSSLTGSLGLSSPLEIYHMNRLLRQGAVGDYAAMLDVLATNQRALLTQEQIAKADAWSEAEFGRSFRNSPMLSSDPIPCANDGS